MKKKIKKQKKTLQIPQQLLFQPPVFKFHKRQNQKIIKQREKSKPAELIYSQVVMEQDLMIQNQFTAEDRQSLKNAFRYICRLIFKEAPQYVQTIKQIALGNDIQIEHGNDPIFVKMFQKAQEISGERYFRKYIANFQIGQQKTICQYMKWFLTKKYLRYISEQGKGKRKMMKKTLYIKFKNEVMLPYIQSLL